MLEFVPALPIVIGVFLVAAGVWAWVTRAAVIGSTQSIRARKSGVECDESPSLPRRVTWFAPWRWSRRSQLATISLALATYVLSPPIVEYAIQRTGIGRTSPRAGRVLSGPQDAPLWRTFRVVFWPHSWLRARSSAVRDLYAYERNTLVSLFGSPPRVVVPSRSWYHFEVRRDGGAWAAGGGIEIHYKDQFAQILVIDGHLSANGRGYGAVPDGSKIILEDDGRVLVNGEEKQPEN